MVSEQTYFSCTQCGDCCNGFGGTYLTDEDMTMISDHLGISISSFKEKYCARSGERFVLAQRNDGFCIFYDRNCSIHNLKPKMCRQWPFIDSLLKDIGNWRIMSSVCPGIHADADVTGLRNYLHSVLGKSSCLS